MKKGLLLLLGTLVLTQISCKKDEQIETLGDALVWRETQCNDPWSTDVDRNDPDYNAKLQSWLVSKTGVSISKPLRKNVPGTAEACTECACKTGNTIYIFPNDNKREKFLAMGFRKL